MVTPSANFANYAKGWQVNGANNWWHTGAVDGTASIWVRSNSGYTWAIVMNKRVADGTAPAFWAAVDGMGWNCISGASGFPAFDLLDAPTLNASNLMALGDGVSTMDLDWTNGNGSARVVVMKDITNNTDPYNFSSYPLDGNDYTANTIFGSGDDLGDGSYVVYNGTGNSVTVTGLDNTKRYAIRVYDFKKNANNGNNALYLLGNPAEREALLGLEDNILQQALKLYPTITNGTLYIHSELPERLNFIIYDLQGRNLMKGNLEHGENELNVSNMRSGMYLVSVTDGNRTMVSRFIRK
jgi:hypothetical protein